MTALDKLVAALGPDIVKRGTEVPERHHQDRAGLDPVPPAGLVLPRSVEHVSTALSICHAEHQPVVTQGGLTGLAGGAHPYGHEIALSLERMVGVEEVDLASGTLTALAGTPLQVVQEAAEAADLMCGIDLGARGSCTIGGNVATNAGGNQVLRYGMARKNILGLEVVTADGTIVRSLNKMMKNNAGYDWTQLFIGTEGTLGVVTRVVLGLHPKPRGIETALLAVDGVETALKALRFVQARAPGGLIVFEAMWREMYEIATTTVGIGAPIERGHDLYLLVEIAGGPTREAGSTAMEDVLGALYEEGLLQDAVIAKSSAEAAKLWALRESIYDYARFFPKKHVGFDISIPLDRIGEAVAAFRRDVPATIPDALLVMFGHLADSNMHVIVLPAVPSEELKTRTDKLVYETTASLGGSVSAEHGIGRSKRAYLSLSRTPAEIALMQTIKTALDPAGILNPGRVL